MSKKHRFKFFPLEGFVPAIVVLVLTGCATTIHLPSHWPEKPVIVDGKNTEWETTYLIDDNKLIISFVNDSNFVYLLLATNDRPLAMSMMRGFTVWFDTSGGDGRTFGIHYPTGGRLLRERMSGGTEGDEQVLDPGEQIGNGLTELEILGPGKNERHRMQVMETGGIQVRYVVNVNSFVYELKVPLAKGEEYPFALHSQIGALIGLGLETSHTNAQKRDQNSGARDTGVQPAEETDDDVYGNRGVPGGMRSGEGRGFGQGGSRGSMGPLDIWMQVKLVVKDAPPN